MNSPPIPYFFIIYLGAFQTDSCYPTCIYYFTTSNGLRTNDVVMLPHAAEIMCFIAGGGSSPLDSNACLTRLYVVQKVAAQGKLEIIALGRPAYRFLRLILDFIPPC
jgi:hypothetical protein